MSSWLRVVRTIASEIERLVLAGGNGSPHSQSPRKCWRGSSQWRRRSLMGCWAQGAKNLTGQNYRFYRKPQLIKSWNGSCLWFEASRKSPTKAGFEFQVNYPKSMGRNGGAGDQPPQKYVLGLQAFQDNCWNQICPQKFVLTVGIEKASSSFYISEINNRVCPNSVTVGKSAILLFNLHYVIVFGTQMNFGIQ